MDFFRIICFWVFIVLYLPVSYAQAWFEKGKDDKGNLNFFLIQKEAEKHFQTIDITQKGVGYKPYKRWEEKWKHRVNKDGSFPEAGINQKNFNEYLKSYKNESRNINSANWSNLGPNITSGGYLGLGRINCVAFHPVNPEIIWVGSPGGGLWKSTDNGLSWFTNFDTIGVLGVAGIVIDPTNPDIMYIATGDSFGYDTNSIGVLKSTDGGVTWQNTGLDWTASQGRKIRKLLMDPNDNNMLMAATSEGLFRTINAGITWTLVSTESFWDLEANPNVDTNIFYGATNNRLYTSYNNGATWTPIQEINANYRIALGVSPNDPNVVYALCSNNFNDGFNGMYKSTNAGGSYTLVSSTPNILSGDPAGNGDGGQGWYDLCISVDPKNANVVYTGGINIWKSEDGGVSWALKTHWYGASAQEVHADQHTLEWQNNTTLWVGNDGGVYKTNNGGLNWTDWSSGLIISQMYRMDIAQQDTKIITGLQDNGTKLRQTSGNWTDRIGGDGMDCHISPDNSNVMYASWQFGNFYRSTNGSDFSAMGVPDGGTGGWITPLAIDPSNTQNVYIGYNRIQKSTNQGESWTTVSEEINAEHNLTYLAVAPSNGNILYTGAHWIPVYRSDDGGVTWTARTSPAEGLEDFVIHPENPDIIWTVHSGYTSGVKVFKSIDGGYTWTNISGNLPNVPVNCIIYQTGSEDGLYIGLDVGVFYIDNTLPDWVLFNQGLPNVRVNDLKIKYDTGELYAATYGRGAWKSPLYSSEGICANPGVLNIYNVGVHSARVTWISSSIMPEGYEYAVTTSPAPPASGVFTTETQLELTNLLSNTTYFFHVRSVCTEDFVSLWTSSFSFLTQGTCDDLLTDTGGETENYSDNENLIQYICPDGPDKKVVITFTQFGVEEDYDVLYIYDGPSISSPLFSSGNSVTLSNFPAGGYFGNSLPGPFTSTHPTGCLTLQFRTDYAVTENGWKADVTCEDNIVCNLALELTVTHESCHMCNNGFVSVNVNGGSGQYNYTWSNGAISSNSGPLSPGIHYVEVIDSNLCTISDTIIIDSYVCPGFAVIPMVEDVFCFGECNGEVDLTLSNGSQNFQVLWDDGNTDNSRKELCEGTYQFTITDVDNCIISDSVTVYQPEAFLLDTFYIVSAQNGESGSITIDFLGGQGDIVWYLNGIEYVSNDSLPLNQMVFFDLTPECYIISGIDESGCKVKTDSICVDNISSTGDVEKFRFSVFPNPAMDLIHISNISESQDFSLQISDMYGIILHTSKNQKMVNISTFNSGIYCVTISTAHKIYSLKLIKI